MEVQNYEDNYLIYPNGKVQNKKRRRFLTAIINSNGYYTVDLYKNGVRKNFKVHRLIAIHYIPNNNPNFKIINHKNGDRLDNSINNVEWCDQLWNTQSKNRKTNVGNVCLIEACRINPYQAKITINRVIHHKYFKTEQQAREWMLEVSNK